MSGLRGRLLISTGVFVLIAVALAYPVLAGSFRNNWLEERGQAAQIAAKALEAERAARDARRRELAESLPPEPEAPSAAAASSTSPTPRAA